MIIEKENKSDMSKATILIAEDDDINFRFMEIMFSKKKEFIIIRAKNGLEAVEVVKSNPDIACILMDFKMPGMNGYEATKIIKEFRKDIPIIVVTSYAMSGDREKSLEAGCDDYISKPFDIDEIISKLYKLLS